MTEEPQLNAELGRRGSRRAGSGGLPVARPAKPRLLQDGRDMFWSLTPLVLGCILLAGMVGMCSFQPGGHQGAIPSYDAAAALRADAATLGFPIRLPKLPAGWQANSGGRGGIENGRTDPSTGQRLNAATSIVGYISPTGMYLSLTQSNADEDKLVGSIHSSAYPTGTVDVAGTNWVVYQRRRPKRCGRRAGVDHPAGRPGRGHPDRDHRCRRAPISSVRWRRRHNRSRRLPDALKEGRA